MNLAPNLFCLERQHLGAHSAFYRLNGIWGSSRKTSVKEANHVVARLSICENDLVGDVDEEVQGVGLRSRGGELRVDACGAGGGGGGGAVATVDAAAGEGGSAGSPGVGDGGVGVAGGVKSRRVGVCTVGF